MNTHTMKLKWIAALALMLASLSMVAQDSLDMRPSSYQSLSLELFGAHNTIGLNYDRRFKGNDGLGFRVGLGYGYSESSYFMFLSHSIHDIAIPLEINYLLGKGRHKLELGLGANIGYYNETYYLDKAYVPQGMSQYNYTLKRSTFGYFMYGNIGYRLQTNRGFQFRIGLTPSFNFGDKYGLHREWYYPYVSFGWGLK